MLNYRKIIEIEDNYKSFTEFRPFVIAHQCTSFASLYPNQKIGSQKIDSKKFLTIWGVYEYVLKYKIYQLNIIISILHFTPKNNI